MGFLDWLFPKKPDTSLARICHQTAYFVLPQHAHQELEPLVERIKAPAPAGPFFYNQACQQLKITPVAADAARLKWHHGYWDGGREYFALQYPTPAPLDIAGRTPENVQRLIQRGRLILAPFYSVIVRPAPGGAVRYFVLAQAPQAEGTTLREVTPEKQTNLGPGPEPRLSALLEVIAERKPWRQD